MNVYLPHDYAKEKVVLFFQFEDRDGNRFGEPLIGIIDIDLPEDDMIENLRPVESSSKFEKKNPIKQSSLIDDNILYQIACTLTDEGYGTFERCL